jgi:hypothetical protein
MKNGIARALIDRGGLVVDSRMGKHSSRAVAACAGTTSAA